MYADVTHVTSVNSHTNYITKWEEGLPGFCILSEEIK